MWISDNWKDYELIDAHGGERLERWGAFILIRPDPQIIWGIGNTKGECPDERKNPLWKKADGVYRRIKGGGSWVVNKMPEEWCIGYPSVAGDFTFRLRPMGFKHTGLFPEQATNWDWTSGLIRGAVAGGGKPKVLNLFAYTGGATVAAAKAGASVCHVDASKGMVNAAKDNMKLSGLEDAPCRYIVDDCKKFVERELRRGNRYDGIIMDPPSYGRGPNGELWKLEECADELITLTAQLLSDNPLFFLINSYTTGLSPATMSYLLLRTLPEKLKAKARSEASELGLRVKETGLALPCGASVRVEF